MMDKLRAIVEQIGALFRRSQTHAELGEEIQHHLEVQTRANLQSGMTPQEARRQALIAFGGTDWFTERVREERWGWAVWIEQSLRDLRISTRTLRRSPGFSLAVIGTLALCIGANTSVLSALYGLVLKPLPVEEPERLVQLFNVLRTTQNTSNSSWNQYSELKKRTDLFQGIALRHSTTKIIHDGSTVRRVEGQTVSVEFFDLMGATPLLGRFFSPEEIDPGPGHVVVLTQSDWEDEFDADLNVLGRQLIFDQGIPYTIIGVAPRSMEVFDSEARFFIPFEVDERDRNPVNRRYSSRSNDLWLRLNGDVSRDAALEQIQEAEHRWFEEVANADARESYKDYQRFAFDLPRPLENSLYLLEGGSLLILLVGCFNVVNLLLSRVNQKHQELSVRSYLGAGKNALRRLMLVESALLIAAATGVGMALAWGGKHVFNRYLVILSPGSMPVELDWPVLAGTLAITVGAVTVMGLLPLEILERSGLLQRVNSSSQRTFSAGGLSRRLSNGMVVGQVAIAFTMLIGTGLLFRSFRNVLTVDTGFDAEQIVQGRIDYQSIAFFYESRAEAAGVRRRIYDGMTEIPGVESVSLSQYNMFAADDRNEGQNFLIRGEALDPSHVRTVHYVTPEFFTTMGIPIMEGRNFNSSDDQNSVIVDELFARRYFGDRSAVGAEVYWNTTTPPPPGGTWERIVGVVARANLLGLEERDGVPLQFLSDPVDQGSWEYTILLRTSRPAAGVIGDMEAKLREIDPRIPLTYAGAVDESFDEMLLGRKAITLLLAAFSGLALLLSVAGVYSVQAYEILQRKREVAIRVAVGATGRNIVDMVMRQGMKNAGVGLVLGVAGAVTLSGFLSGLLFDVAPVDAQTYVGVLLLLTVVAAGANVLPAFRAMKTDPREALAE